MCKRCVEEGMLTQAELDAVMAAGDPTVLPLGGDGVEFLRKALGLSSLDEKASRDLAAIETEALRFLEQDLPVTPESPEAVMLACEDMAGKAMYRLDPRSVALLAMVLVVRLRDARREGGHEGEPTLAAETTSPSPYV